MNVYVNEQFPYLDFMDIRPGDRVVLKPNLVKEGKETDKNEWKCVVTSPELIRYVANYVCEKLGGKGEVYICDAPQTDSSFEHNYKGCKSNGILVGGYKYSYALTPAQAIDEAESVISVLGGRGMDFPIFYDLEWSQQRNLGKQAIENIAVAFLTRIKKAGYKVGIYCNLDWYNNVLSDTLKKYDCWIARYPASDNGSVQERLRPSVGVGWQYSSRGKVSGISGNVDMDAFYKDYKEEVSAMDKAIEKVILIAKNEIGYLEKKNNSQLDSKTANAGSNNYTKYWRDIKPSYQGQPWCAAFVSWCFMEAFGQEKAKKLLKHWPYVYCPTLGNLFTRNANPKIGDIVIFYHNGTFTHTGIVTAVIGDRFYTIEGNTSGASGIIANGETELYNIEHIDRGYENIEEKFRKLGAHIERVVEE